MVGDSFRDDVVCGNRAGATTVLLDTEGMHACRGESMEGEQRPHYYATSLSDVEGILRHLLKGEELPPGVSSIERR